MSTTTTTQQSTTNSQAPKPAKKIFKRIKRILYFILFALVLVIAASVYWKYYFNYSDGYRAGLLQKFSHKGNIFKTYEGEMILSSVQSSKNVTLASEKFFFSVCNKQIVRKLDSLQGDYIVVHYRQKNGTLPWRGESDYLVDSVKVQK
jgi:hypothetical protein